jgi:hypothetical protein
MHSERAEVVRRDPELSLFRCNSQGERAIAVAQRSSGIGDERLKKRSTVDRVSRSPFSRNSSPIRATA